MQLSNSQKAFFEVVIQLYKADAAKFITAFVADDGTLAKIKADPVWEIKKKDAD